MTILNFLGISFSQN